MPDQILPSDERRATTRGPTTEDRGATRVSDQSVLGPDRIKHLEFIQAVVTRFATSSFLIKGWALTIAAALLAVLASQLKWGIALVGVVPVVAFWFLDGYFLWQERLYRKLYDDVRKPNSGVELMSMNTAAYAKTTTFWDAVFSRTLVLFFGSLLLVDVGLVLVGLADWILTSCCGWSSSN
jgi:hypothetical protein